MAKKNIGAMPKNHDYEILFTTSVFSLESDDLGCHGNQQSMSNMQLRNTMSFRNCP